ncbi:unnamed protein product [Acanthoscelides obtectus]|uniref:Cadherin domain-containing protein n=1 Tax=Acanthoscelides obtectus TaxID=200917 RepID=A0A9P0NV59_ACAOB|nr:unnamed protein product [Acanthoscelides obtectus]CAK1642233.1 Neural-cadherin [Acanthoscelides obtectus]
MLSNAIRTEQPNSSSSKVVTKFIRIGIADKNDNPPYFDKALYEAEVDENEDIQHTVLTVTAKDHDEYIVLLLKRVTSIMYMEHDMFDVLPLELHCPYWMLYTSVVYVSMYTMRIQ